MDITGRKLFVKALEEEGVDTIFAYPVVTVTDLFDELYPELPTQLQVLQMRIMTMCRLCALQDRYRFHLSEMMPFRKWI